MPLSSYLTRVTNILGTAVALTLDAVYPCATFSSSSDATKIRIMFVCLGNICRSPLAEALFARNLQEHGLAGYVDVCSAAVSDANEGKGPFWRARRCARRHGLSIAHHRAHQVTLKDLRRCDYVLAMDKANLEHLCAMVPSESEKKKIRLLLSDQEADVPDPIKENQRGFETVYILLEQGCDQLLVEVRQRLNQP